jgi:transcriptional regulator with XRE-family HTH domain
MTVSKYIKSILEERKIPQSELARLIGISRESLYPMLQGTINPSEETVSKIEKVLKIKIPYEKVRGYAGYKLLITTI